MLCKLLEKFPKKRFEQSVFKIIKTVLLKDANSFREEKLMIEYKSCLKRLSKYFFKQSKHIIVKA